MVNTYERVHFIGICGSGLSAIATVLLERGIKVSGSDRGASSVVLERLQRAGADIFLGHDPKNILGADLVIRSSAIPDHNPEVKAAISAGVLVLKRNDFLADLIADQKCIAVAGTHGKTTTTAMIAWILMSLGCDPSFVVGSKIEAMDRNAHSGKGKYFVIEADEYDRMFLGMNPVIEVITNIEHDHPDCFPTETEYNQAFREFIARLEPGGVLVFCGDDPIANSISLEAKKEGCQAVSYGIRRIECDYMGVIKGINTLGGCNFSFQHREMEILSRIELNIPGEHNVLNALAALSVAEIIGLPMKEVGKALEKFEGTSRRFQIRGEHNHILVIDDYAHHPTEIRATLAAARTRFPDRRIWAVWQPHTYSRTRTFFNQYINSFTDADCVMVTEIYSARESVPEDNFSSQQIVETLSNRMTNSDCKVLFAPNFTSGCENLLSNLIPGDVVLVLSAGDAEKLSKQLLEALSLADSDQKEKSQFKNIR